MSMEPPPFEEASRCNVCKCSFTTFRRRHHCRCCGRTFCAEHSSIQMDLPQFGILSDVRVCAQCFNNASSEHCTNRSKKDDTPAFSNGVNAVTDSVSRLDINVVADTKSAPTAEKLPVPGILECKCRMPLCICEAPAPPSDSVSLQVKTTSIPTVQSSPKPKKADPSPKSRGSTSNSKSSTIFNLGQAPNNSLDRTSTDYDISGEGLRGAIKNGDTASAKKLLSLGVEANYCDKQGSSLLHLAAVFNRTEIAFALMDHGASMDCKNLQGETPLDCAPVTLQYRMKKKMEESVHVVP